MHICGLLKVRSGHPAFNKLTQKSIPGNTMQAPWSWNITMPCFLAFQLLCAAACMAKLCVHLLKVIAVLHHSIAQLDAHSTTLLECQLLQQRLQASIQRL